MDQHHRSTSNPKTKIGLSICLNNYFVGFSSSSHFCISRISEVKFLQNFSHFSFELNHQKSYLPSAFHPEIHTASGKTNVMKTNISQGSAFEKRHHTNLRSFFGNRWEIKVIVVWLQVFQIKFKVNLYLLWCTRLFKTVMKCKLYLKFSVYLVSGHTGSTMWLSIHTFIWRFQF